VVPVILDTSGREWLSSCWNTAPALVWTRLAAEVATLGDEVEQVTAVIAADEQMAQDAMAGLTARREGVADLQRLFQQEAEIARVTAYSSLLQQVKAMAETEHELQSQTRNLVNALRSPTVRGRWGEIQLKRVCELAGMLNYCDFIEQGTTSTIDGVLRPDLKVRLPGGKIIIVDAKTPIQAYLEAVDAADDIVRAVTS